jgi:hypothetical protein
MSAVKLFAIRMVVILVMSVVATYSYYHNDISALSMVEQLQWDVTVTLGVFVITSACIMITEKLFNSSK